jgi:hypothetical protein
MIKEMIKKVGMAEEEVEVEEIVVIETVVVKKEVVDI